MTDPLLDLHHKVALITGASGGLGGEIASCLSAAGAAVALAYHLNRSAAETLAETIEGSGGRAGVYGADITDPEAVAGLVKAIKTDFGGIDILVNNAGTFPVSALMETTVEDWDGVIASNLRATFLCTQATARLMIEKGQGGAIINIASIAASRPMDGLSHYSAAKAGVVALTRSSAAELGQHGIRVNAVSPGLIRRDGLEDDWPEGVAGWKAAAPLGRLGEAHDIANACLYLASGMAAWITGINLVVDGGNSAANAF